MSSDAYFLARASSECCRYQAKWSWSLFRPLLDRNLQFKLFGSFFVSVQGLIIYWACGILSDPKNPPIYISRVVAVAGIEPYPFDIVCRCMMTQSGRNAKEIVYLVTIVKAESGSAYFEGAPWWCIRAYTVQWKQEADVNSTGRSIESTSLDRSNSLLCLLNKCGVPHTFRLFYLCATADPFRIYHFSPSTHNQLNRSG